VTIPTFIFPDVPSRQLMSRFTCQKMEIAAQLGNNELPLVPDEDRHVPRQAAENDLPVAVVLSSLSNRPLPFWNPSF
jgi:hypothetical protein